MAPSAKYHSSTLPSRVNKSVEREPEHRGRFYIAQRQRTDERRAVEHRLKAVGERGKAVVVRVQAGKGGEVSYLLGRCDYSRGCSHGFGTSFRPHQQGWSTSGDWRGGVVGHCKLRRLRRQALLRHFLPADVRAKMMAR